MSEYRTADGLDLSFACRPYIGDIVVTSKGRMRVTAIEHRLAGDNLDLSGGTTEGIRPSDPFVIVYMEPIIRMEPVR